MKTFVLNGQPVEFDETLEYADFYLEGGRPNCTGVNWDKLLTLLQEDALPWDEAAQQFVRDLSRWVHEAPRKRFFRNLRLQGATVMSSEYFFEQDGGDEFITALENTGKIAARVCEAYGLEPMRPLYNASDMPIPAEQTESYQIPK